MTSVVTIANTQSYVVKVVQTKLYRRRPQKLAVVQLLLTSCELIGSTENSADFVLMHRAHKHSYSIES